MNIDVFIDAGWYAVLGILGLMVLGALMLAVLDAVEFTWAEVRAWRLRRAQDRQWGLLVQQALTSAWRERREEEITLQCCHQAARNKRQASVLAAYQHHVRRRNARPPRPRRSGSPRRVQVRRSLKARG